MLRLGSKLNVFSWLKVWLQHLASWIAICTIGERYLVQLPNQTRRMHRAPEDVSTCLSLMITNSGTQEVTSGVTISPLLPKVTCLTSEVGVDYTQLVPGYTVMRLVETHRPWPESCTDLRRCVFAAQPLNLE